MSHGQIVDQYRQLWDELDRDGGHGKFPDVGQFLANHPPESPRDRLAVLLVDQFRRWQADDPQPVSEYLALLDGYDPDDELKVELLDEEIGYLEERDDNVDVAEFLSQFPDLSDRVRDQLGVLASASQSTHSHSTVRSRPAIASNDLVARETIGRYRVMRQLGRGSFGVVYLAQDSELEREVAIKLPSQERLELAGGADSFLREARVVAGLDDSGIVPVYDVGKLENGDCYVVSKYVRGGDLRKYMRETTVSHLEAARLVSALARSLHQAHRKGLVHRDIKPGNVLMDGDGQPHIIDFGLALRDEEVTSNTSLVGTPAYMSPEQARGEGHRVDPRSDIYSLGVVLYELLTGRRPHQATSASELLELVKNVEARPPRQHDDGISRELDRICLRALARRRAERYSTALDLAEELEAYIEEASDRSGKALSDPDSTSLHPESAARNRLLAQDDSNSAGTESGKLRIVPKGLRSFDAADADFFLELIPGPRDRHGLPDSIRFWKRKLEETDPRRTFPVGLLYGPSGCGKSSLVKAGLIPRLGKHVEAFYFEASSEDIESNILDALKRHFPQLESSSSIADAMASLRRDVLQPGQKCVLIIDQFEQWLNSWDGHPCPLIQALLQCDGARVQAIVGVRDDFWMAATRFMRELEVRLIEGENSAAVDLFGERHAQEVLAAFGRAYGGLPTRTKETKSEHTAFVRHAVSDLAEDGKVVPVRLALFAQMLKNREWKSSTLYRLGGASGVGVAFLEEAFGQHAPPSNRMHADAAKAVLDALQPGRKSNIRGSIQPHEKLLAASGYTDPRMFSELLRLLDDDLRLITPVDVASTTDSVFEANPDSEQFYQLTHDFLVPSIRDWMNRRRQTSRAGRAELRLKERAAVWRQRPEFRALPSILEYLTISAFTKRHGWTKTERRMMSSASKSYGVLAVIVFIAILGVGLAAREFSGRMRAVSFRDQLMLAETSDVPALMEENGFFQRWWVPLLKQDLSGDRLQPNQQRNVAMALLPNDPSQLEVLEREILTSRPEDLPVLIAAVQDHGSDVANTMRMHLDSDDRQQRLNAASALSLLKEELGSSQIEERVAQDLITSQLRFSGYLPLIRSHSKKLVPWWLEFAESGPDSQRNAAAIALNEYYEPAAEELANLIELCNAEQFQTIFPLIEKHRDELLPILQSRFAELRHTPWPSSNRHGLINESFKTKLRSAHGIVHPDFALAMWLPLEEIEPLINAMAEEGYRPTRLRPFPTVDGFRAAVMWTRDDRLWKFELGLSAEAIQSKTEEYSKQDLLPCDVAGYALPDQTERFAVIWEAPVSQGERREFYFGKTAEESAELTKKYAARGYRVFAQHFYSLPQEEIDEEKNVAIRHDMIWGFDTNHVDEYYVDAFNEEEFAAASRAYDCPIDVCIANTPERGGQYGGVWAMVDRAFDREVLSGVPLDEHLELAQALVAQGYRPVSLSAAELDGNHNMGASVWTRPKTTPEQQARYARQQGNLAAALIRLGHLPRVLARLKADCDPDLRTELTHVANSHGCDPGPIVEALQADHSRETQQTLLLALGDFPLNVIPSKQREGLLQAVRLLHTQNPDAGVHAAAEWCLTQWEQPIQRDALPLSTDRDWYRNVLGQTMIVVDLSDQAEPFVAGCHRGEIGAKWRERTYSVWIQRRFAIAAHETTAGHFSRFAREVPDAAFVIREDDPPEMAQNRVNWFQAARFCIWLSELEGIPPEQWCYTVQDDGTLAIASDYLSKAGYRLPTEAEWEYCCRTGTRDVRSFGDSARWLGQYAWFEGNSEQAVQEVGRLKPNTFGLFDMLGNVGEWCHERWLSTLKRSNKAINVDYEDDLIADRDYMRVNKGGTFAEVASDLRSADRTGIFPYAGSDATGFRVVRTLPNQN